MKILITGSAGFVGRHFCQALATGGNDLTLIDIVDGNDCRDFFRESDERFDLVIHLAAIVGGRLTIEGQPLKVATDLAIDSDMFQWAVRTKPRHVVYYSSSAAYPIALQDGSQPIKLSENMIDLGRPLIGMPDFTYGWAKLTGEILAWYAEEAGVRVHVFRPFSGYGDDQDAAYPFGAFRDRAVTETDPFEVWGDGTQTRDFIHIDDIVNATLLAVDLDVPGPINLCTGKATSFIEMAKLFVSEAGYKAQIKTLPDKPVGVLYRVGDPTKLETFYRPRITLEEGISRAVRGGSR